MKFRPVIAMALWCVSSLAFANEPATPVEINGDEVQYSVSDTTVSAVGHVVVKRAGVTLMCDRMDFDRNRNVGIAEGHVVLLRQGSRLTGDKMIYNFSTMKGEFIEAKIAAKPLYGSGQRIAKEGENHVILTDGYITTCDLDKPHFRMKAKRVDIYQGDKAIAHNVSMTLGKVPVLWLPFYVQDLKHKKPMFIITPGYDKHWGSFVLTQWRYYWNDHINTVLHVDERSRNGIGEGFDLNYNNSPFGNGLFRVYYINDQKSKRKFFFDSPQPPSPEVTSEERYKLEWRNKWKIDEETSAIWQFYKLKDVDLLKDFFKREYDQDASPPTYFLMTRSYETAGTMSLRTDLRVNDFNAAVNRLPEVNYTLPGYKLFGSGFYLNNNTTFSNLTQLHPSPDANQPVTARLDTDNQISYPFKVNIFQLRPFAGGRETYYSRTAAPDKIDGIRGVFKTGADVSTKFFRVYDVHTNFLNLDINRLRHVITPGVAYFYTHDPTLPSSNLVQFDSIDSQARAHGMTFSLENKLQTKRDAKSVDLARLLLTSNYYLKEDLHKEGFNDVTTQLDLNPNQWLGVYSKAQYDTANGYLTSSNIELSLNEPGKKWAFSVGDLKDRGVDDQITAQFDYRLNPKWYFEIYERCDVMHGISKEQQYTIVRDLHEWDMKLSFSHKDNDGDAIWLVFTLKEFPDLTLDFGSGFNRVKSGALKN